MECRIQAIKLYFRNFLSVTVPTPLLSKGSFGIFTAVVTPSVRLADPVFSILLFYHFFRIFVNSVRQILIVVDVYFG